ncbi:hypothetical protein [Stenotrophomonas maltophilia]|uniref:hypothetical protein n=1 Tax=Stenotrophomonas maltophilia TaxID=40324 RepID=UPI000DA75A4C|nr:hypothetical protein [Stenotrophomonas maltophilia]PZS73495.1 hypothetical protein A7X75_06240 [Stenotrophomonas maltophilia]
MLKNVYLSIWSICLIAWALVLLNFTFSITFTGCGQMQGVALYACDLLQNSIRYILMFGLASLPVLTLAAILRFMLYRVCGRLELCLMVSSLILFGLSARHFTSY